VKALFDACRADSTVAGAQDAAVLALLCGAGLRRTEAVRVQVNDFDPETGRLRVTGKRGRTRHVYALDGARLALRDWLQVRAGDPGPLLCRLETRWRRDKAPMVPKALALCVQRRAQEAGVDRCSPRDLRRTFLDRLKEAFSDAPTIGARPIVPYASVSRSARPRIGQRPHPPPPPEDRRPGASRAVPRFDPLQEFADFRL
ncbi:MAG: site-specific integrase, partial [Rhodospirillales bacterium]|nr:site-specific integrase [Rhodospirillales bacterium]